MPRLVSRLTAPLSTVLLLAAFLVAPPVFADDHDALKSSVRAVREGGVALWNWLEDRLPEDPVARQAALSGEKKAKPQKFAWEEHCTPISTDEVRRKVAPAATLPVQDGWAHALQYCLVFDAEDPAHHLIAVRSPGRDGKFEPGPYSIGPFDPAEVDRDIVWFQGYFTRWPEVGAGASR